ncbi:MAG: hypothetical protein ACFFDK_02860 [Promethearchaeota archaeon]
MLYRCLKIKGKRIKSGKFLSFVAPFTHGWKAVFFQTKIYEKERSFIKKNYEGKQKDKEKKKKKPMAILM